MNGEQNLSEQNTSEQNTSKRRSGIRGNRALALALTACVLVFAWLPVTLGSEPGVAAEEAQSDEYLPPAQKAAEKSFTFTCNTSPTGIVYCAYTGPVEWVYVNSTQFILVYPDPALTAATIQAEVESEGYEAYWDVDVSAFIAFGVLMPAGATEATDPTAYHRDKEFADKLYAMALASRLAERDVTLQMRGAVGGYLRIDRAWIR